MQYQEDIADSAIKTPGIAIFTLFLLDRIHVPISILFSSGLEVELTLPHAPPRSLLAGTYPLYSSSEEHTPARWSCGVQSGDVLRTAMIWSRSTVLHA